jgi:hypothetical protein
MRRETKKSLDFRRTLDTRVFTTKYSRRTLAFFILCKETCLADGLPLSDLEQRNLQSCSTSLGLPALLINNNHTVDPCTRRFCVNGLICYILHTGHGLQDLSTSLGLRGTTSSSILVHGASGLRESVAAQS